MNLKKLLTACGLAALAASTLLLSSEALAAEPARAEAKKKPAAKPKAKARAAAPAVPKEPDPEADEPAVTGTNVVDYDCELGNKITIYENAGDESHIALRWKKRLHRLSRVATTTGAQRFENKLYGLIWIGIPAKGMLLDSKMNRQLANECRNAEQLKPASVEAPHSAAPQT
jgi:membrane-bound inhibitor of C-type lysozyme